MSEAQIELDNQRASDEIEMHDVTGAEVNQCPHCGEHMWSRDVHNLIRHG